MGIMAKMESLSDAFDRVFGKLPDWVQVTLIMIFCFLFDA
jgi:hypothetical protein